MPNHSARFKTVPNHRDDSRMNKVVGLPSEGSGAQAQSSGLILPIEIRERPAGLIAVIVDVLQLFGAKIVLVADS